MLSEKKGSLDKLKIIAFTHKQTPLNELNLFFLHDENRKERLEFLKYTCDINEILYVSTCNRIEFVFTTHHDCNKTFLIKFFSHFRLDWDSEEIKFAVKNAEVYEGENALRHIFKVASSLESLVVGEREIITQVRKSYELCNSEGLTGDFLRLLVKATINTAKQVYTETKIANNPVSVVSLAERELRIRNSKPGARIVMIGAGETNSNLSKYLVKRGFKSFTIFNRTFSKAVKLASMLSTDTISAIALPIEQLEKFDKGFDILIVCTSYSEKIITNKVYSTLLCKDIKSKVVIDLSIPSNIEPEVYENNDIDLIDISQLRSVAEKNKIERQHEIIASEKIIEENIELFHQMHKTRKIEIKMKDVPEKIRQIKDKALNEVFADDIRSLDDHSKLVLGKVLDYMEKKCISVPMILAKEIILESRN